MFFVLILIFISYTHACDVCTLANGTCVDICSPGVLCSECSFRGCVSDGDCICTRNIFNPSTACGSNYVNTSTVLIYKNSSISWCECCANWVCGYWDSSAVEMVYINGAEVFKYGSPNPPTCDECYNFFYGPKGETLTASQISFGIVACIKLGGIDPNLIDTPAPTTHPTDLSGRRRLTGTGEWSECAGHGVWNDTWHACICNEGWGLSYAGEGYNEAPVYLCDICVGGWGPFTPPQQNYMNDMPYGAFCSVPYTPDITDDGILKECGGHGKYQLGECQCDENWAIGNYTLTQSVTRAVADETYETENESFVIETCQQCVFNYTIESGCTVNITTL